MKRCAIILFIFLYIISLVAATEVSGIVSQGGDGKIVKEGDSAKWGNVPESERPAGAKESDPIPSEKFAELVQKYPNNFGSADKQQLSAFVKKKSGAESVDLTTGGSVDLVKGTVVGRDFAIDPDAMKGNDIVAGAERVEITNPDGGVIGSNTGRFQAGGSYSGGGDSGGGSSAGGGSGGGFEQLLGALQQVMSIVSQIGSALKGAASGEGSVQITEGASGTEVKIDDGAEFVAGEEEEGCESVCEDYCDEDDNCQEKCSQVCDSKSVSLSQNNKDGAESETLLAESKLDKITASDNTKIVIPNQIVAYIPEGTSDTTIYNNGIEGDYQSPITGAVVSESESQYIKLHGHSMDVEGEKIVIDLLKTFNEINGEGYELDVNNGNSAVKFYKDKLLYPRRVESSDYGIHRLRNEFDSDNFFILTVNSGYDKNQLVHGKKIISVGNMAVSHPGLEGLMIADIREEMWN